VLIITAGFNLSPALKKELSLARKSTDKEFVYFRDKSLKPNLKIVLDNEELDLGKQQQISFDTKYDLVRKAHSIIVEARAPDMRTRSICAICHGIVVSTLNCKACKSTQSIRKHLIFQTQTKLVFDGPSIMFQVA
jgi:hypothetical protein